MLLFSILTALILASSAPERVTLAWEPNHPSERVTHYRVHRWTPEHGREWQASVYNFGPWPILPRATVHAPVEGASYTVTATNFIGLESDDSDAYILPAADLLATLQASSSLRTWHDVATVRVRSYDEPHTFFRMSLTPFSPFEPFGEILPPPPALATPYSDAVLALSPAAFYLLDEAAPSGSGSVLDSSGNAAHGNPSASGLTWGITSPITSQTSTAAGFDGSAGDINCGTPAGTTGNSAITVAGWIYVPTGGPNYGGAAARMGTAAGTGNTHGWALQTRSSLRRVFVAARNNNSGTWGTTPDNSIPLDTWVHVAFVYNGSLSGNSARLKIYVGGSQIGSMTYNGTIPASLGTTNQPLRIGGAEAGNFGELSCTGLAVFNAALTQAQIQTMIDASTP